MKYQKELIITAEQADEYRHLLTTEPKSWDECMGEDVTISHTVKFDDGIEMDIKLCGVAFDENSESNTPYTEAVLFRNGVQLAYTEPADEYEGEWSLDDDGNTYTVIVKTV